MSSKTWIKIKRGLLEPKHRKAMGKQIWLYLYILDQVDWEAGAIIGWTDEQAAEELGIPVRTLTGQRQLLEKAGYITCTQKVHSQVIVVLNWTNPREYSGEVYNSKGTRNNVPLSPRVRENAYHMVAEKCVPYLLNHIKESHYVTLDCDEFLNTWGEFVQFRKELRKPLTETGGKRLLKKLSQHSTPDAIAMLEQSIENGWQGVFDVKGPARDNGKAAGVIRIDNPSW